MSRSLRLLSFPTGNARRLVVIALSTLAALVQETPPPDPPDPPGTSVDWADNSLVVQAAAPGTLELTDNPGTPYDGPRIYCSWFELVFQSTDIEANLAADLVVGDGYVYNCWYTDPWIDPYPGYPIFVFYDPVVDPPGPVITTPDAARFAVDSIDFEPPIVTTSPAAIHVVGVPSWFAVDSQLSYAAASAQAGPVWATVRPEFRDVTWSLGNGDELVCTNDATRHWDPHARAESTPSECRYTYEAGPGRASEVARLPASATVHWTVWQRTDRTAGAWVVWGTVSVSTPVDIRVIELQAAIN